MRLLTSMGRGQFDRRRFLGGAAIASAAACGKKGKRPFLSDSEMATLTAICDQIIPPDQDPGGAWAGVANYIARQLRGHYREHLRVYHAGLAEADRRAGGNFAALARDRQLELLQQMDKDKETRPFMALVVPHSIQGFYGNPRHGGNRDYCSWRMLGVPASPVRGRDPYDFSKGGAA